MPILPPRLVFSALRGSAGKTTAALGVTAALHARGVAVAPFKKGPDYIDPAWLSLAAGAECRNLDTFLLPGERVKSWCAQQTTEDQVAIIEGNRGLFDGVDLAGTHSTAELAKLLSAPVVLVVDCTKVSRTAAAMIYGCQQLDPGCRIGGVILNQVARSRHEEVLRGCVESICGLPVLGAIPKLRRNDARERHLGLVPPPEHDATAAVLEQSQSLAEKYLDLDALLALARSAEPETTSTWEPWSATERFDGARVGVVRDSVFQFYYPENLAALTHLGATLVELDALTSPELPRLDALYLGGGFPETQAEKLVENASFRQSVRDAVEAGLPTFAECAGLMYLGSQLRVDAVDYPLTGVLPITFELGRRPQGHGYTLLTAANDNPYYPVGRDLSGHEFHYSLPRAAESTELRFAFQVRRGHGFDGEHDGLLHKNVLATYTHFHALGVIDWAVSLLRRAADRDSWQVY